MGGETSAGVTITEDKGKDIYNYRAFFVFDEKTGNVIDQYVSPDFTNKTNNLKVEPFSFVRWQNKNCGVTNNDCEDSTIGEYHRN
jgi:hypothetical protein